MQEPFAYVARDVCVCGARLEPTRVKVDKPTRWGPLRFVECDACGTAVQSPQISRESLQAWFSSPEYYAAADRTAGGPYLDYLADEAHRQVEASARYRRDLRALLPAGANVLEVGCATGSMLAVLARHGHRVTGVDLSEAFVDAAKRLNGLSVTLGDFVEIDVGGDFDLVLLLGTVSNLRDLSAAFARCRALLRPQGWLYFNMPVVDSWIARLYGARFWMYSPSCAAVLSMTGCARALQREGFRVVGARTDYQQPTFAKLAGHLKVKALYPWLSSLRLAHRALPVTCPIPGVTVVFAQKTA